MDAGTVLAAIRRHHRDAAILSEVVIKDPDWLTTHRPGDIIGYQRRIDGLMFEALLRTAIEVKVTRADAARDDYRKIEAWRRVTHRFVYAVPAGLIEHPPVYGCGLWWVHDDGRVEVKRRTKIIPTPEPLPQSVVQALAFRAARVPTAATETGDG